jgi:hypothetical protein
LKIAELIDIAKMHGYNKVTDRQVRLWTQEKLIPSEASKGKGYKLSYPNEAGNQLLKLCELKEKGIVHYDDLAWSLFLLKYSIPTEKIQDGMRLNASKLPIKISDNDIYPKNICYLILAIILNSLHEVTTNLNILEFIKDMIDTEIRTCLGIGNSFKITSHNIPESIVLLKEEQQHERLIDFNEYCKIYKNDEYDILTRKNYTVPPDADDALIDKLIFFQRVHYLMNVILYIAEKTNINKCIEDIPSLIIEQYRDAFYPLLFEIERIYSPYKSIYSLCFPIVWNIINIFEHNFKYDDWFPDTVQDEAWFNNSPLRAVANMIHALRHTTKPIIKP